MPRRKYCLKIDELPAIMLEKYPDCFQTESIDHMIARAPDVVFRKGANFKAWISDDSGTARLPGFRRVPIADLRGEKLDELFCSSLASVQNERGQETDLSERGREAACLDEKLLVTPCKACQRWPRGRPLPPARGRPPDRSCSGT